MGHSDIDSILDIRAETQTNEQPIQRRFLKDVHSEDLEPSYLFMI